MYKIQVILEPPLLRFYEYTDDYSLLETHFKTWLKWEVKDKLLSQMTPI